MQLNTMTASIPQVSPQDLASRLQAPDGSIPLLLDVRTPMEHQEMHIPGTKLVPLDQLDASAICSAHGKGQEVVVICRSGARASKAAQKLAEAGMHRLSVLEGGTLAWHATGLAVNRGRKVMSLERQVRIAAGSIALLGVVLGTWVHPGFYGLSAFVGAGLVFAGITDWCGMGLLLAKAPWNQVASHSVASSR